MDFSLGFSGRSIKRVLMGERGRVRAISWALEECEPVFMLLSVYPLSMAWRSQFD